MEMIAIILAVIGTVTAPCINDCYETIFQRQKKYACAVFHLDSAELSPIQHIAVFQFSQLSPEKNVKVIGIIRGLPAGRYVLAVHEKNVSQINCNSLDPIKSISRDFEKPELVFTSNDQHQFSCVSGQLDTATLVPHLTSSIVEYPMSIHLTTNAESSLMVFRDRCVAFAYVSPGRCTQETFCGSPPRQSRFYINLDEPN